MARFKVEPWLRTVKCHNGPLDGEFRYLPPAWTAFQVLAQVRNRTIDDPSGYYAVRPMSDAFAHGLWTKLKNAS